MKQNDSQQGTGKEQSSIFNFCCQSKRQNPKDEITMAMKKKETEKLTPPNIPFISQQNVHVVNRERQIYPIQEDVRITRINKSLGNQNIRFTYLNAPINPSPEIGLANLKIRVIDAEPVIIRPLNAKAQKNPNNQSSKVEKTSKHHRQFLTPNKNENDQSRNTTLISTFSHKKSTLTRQDTPDFSILPKDKQERRRFLVDELMKKFARAEIDLQGVVEQSKRISIALARED